MHFELEIKQIQKENKVTSAWITSNLVPKFSQSQSIDVIPNSLGEILCFAWATQSALTCSIIADDMNLKECFAAGGPYCHSEEEDGTAV